MAKKAMYNLTYGLFVLTAKEGDKQNGCIINTAIQVTTKPNRISITVNKDNYTHDLVAHTGEFNISILSSKAIFATFEHFGFRSGRDVDKFADYHAYKLADNGIAYITEGTNAYLSAKVIEKVDAGTHTIFIADVTAEAVLDDAPSVTYAEYQENIKPKPQATPADKTVWRCSVCGYEYEGEEIPEDFICPWCKHPASDFVKA